VDSVLTGYHVLCITSATTDLDRKFDEALQSLTLDVEGKLVQSFTLSGTHALSGSLYLLTESFTGLFNVMHGMWASLLSEWVEKCHIDGDCP
jgi:nuclear mRNA export protein SAC3